MISQRTCMKMYYSLPTCTCHTFCVYNITRLLRYGTLGVYEENLASPLRDTTPLKAVSSSCTVEKLATRVCIMPRSLYLKDYVVQLLMNNNLLGVVVEYLDCCLRVLH